MTLKAAQRKVSSVRHTRVCLRVMLEFETLGSASVEQETHIRHKTFKIISR